MILFEHRCRITVWNFSMLQVKRFKIPCEIFSFNDLQLRFSDLRTVNAKSTHFIYNRYNCYRSFLQAKLATNFVSVSEENSILKQEGSPGHHSLFKFLFLSPQSYVIQNATINLRNFYDVRQSSLPLNINGLK